MATANNIVVTIGADTYELTKGVNNAKKEVNQFEDTIKGMGSKLAQLFAVNEVINFGKEVSKLAAEADGVAAAFSRIATKGDLDVLKEKTKGTVSELELMKATVNASNFGIPVKELGNLLAFAQQRAKETGQSVDFLVQSLVTGLGRKSTQILDNLGITATALKEKLNGASLEMLSVGELSKAVGEIGAEAMKKAGKEVETFKEKQDRLNAEFEDAKVVIGKVLNEAVQPLIIGLSKLLKAFTDTKAAMANKAGAAMGMTIADAIISKGEGKTLEERASLIKGQIEKYTTYIQSAKARISELEKKISTEANLGSVGGGDETALMAINAAEGANEKEKLKILQQIAYFDEIRGQLNKAIADITQQQTAELEKQNQLIEEQGAIELENAKKVKDERDKLYASFIPEENKNIFSNMAGPTGAPMAEAKASPIGAQAIDTAIQDSLAKITEGRQKATEELAKFTDFVDQLNMELANGFADLIGTLAEGLGALAAGANSEEFGKKMLEQVGGFMSSMGKMLIAYGVANSIFATLLKSPPNPATAIALIAAGAAMVAIGGAIKQGASNMASGGKAASVGASNRDPSASFGGQKLETQKVVFEIRGETLVGVLANQNRINARV